MAAVSRLDKIIGLFCRVLSLLWDSFVKETYDVIDPTHRRHPIPTHTHITNTTCILHTVTFTMGDTNLVVCVRAYACACLVCKRAAFLKG